MPTIRSNVARETAVMTDEATWYKNLNKDGAFASHGTVNHGKDKYGRGHVTTNTFEGCYSIFRSDMKGVYERCGERHLHRYLAEFDLRYPSRAALGCGDIERADRALRGAKGKRLTYRSANWCVAFMSLIQLMIITTLKAPFRVV